MGEPGLAMLSGERLEGQAGRGRPETAVPLCTKMEMPPYPAADRSPPNNIQDSSTCGRIPNATPWASDGRRCTRRSGATFVCACMQSTQQARHRFMSSDHLASCTVICIAFETVPDGVSFEEG